MGKTVKSTLNDVKKIVEQRKGELLIDKYEGYRVKFSIKCSNGHIFNTCLFYLRLGGWCPECSTGISERITKKYFELLFNNKFLKVKLKELKTKKGGNLELDGYCKELNIAFEYNGEQHYKFNKKYHKNRTLEIIKQCDRKKKYLCKKNKIILITVPYYIKYENIGKYIIKQCKLRNINIPNEDYTLDYKLFEDIYHSDKLEQLNNLINNKGGKLLTQIYPDKNSKIKIQCSKGHTWETKIGNIKSGNWCIHCNPRTPITFDEVKRLVKEKWHGEIISKKFTPLLNYKCKNGHIFKKNHTHPKTKWCPRCARLNRKKKYNIEYIKEYSKQFNIECISEIYENSYKRLLFKYSCGHIIKLFINEIKEHNICGRCNNPHFLINKIKGVA